MSNLSSFLSKITRKVSGVGPGLMAIGFTIGTGSVTAMTVAGNDFGMDLLWVLALSCFFSWILMNAYGRYSLVTGETVLYSLRHRVRFGSWMAILIIVGITIGQWNSLIGILGISAHAVFEVLSLVVPGVEDHSYITILLIAVTIVGIMYAVLWQGKYSYIERVLTFFVALMGLSFLVSLFVILPSPTMIAKGFIPSVPKVAGGNMLVAAFVGTTMAAATFLSRPLFLNGKGWTIDNLEDQNKDSLTAALLIFFISGSIMTIAASTLYGQGHSISRVLDMVGTLEPILGRLALGIFVVGIMGAGLSSVFPILMITPLLIADYRKGELDVHSKQFKIITAVACLVGLTVPIFGSNPINAQILSQVFNVFVLPLVIISIIYLINKESLMGKHKASFFMNVGMVLALIFACIISYTGVIGIIESL